MGFNSDFKGLKLAICLFRITLGIIWPRVSFKHLLYFFGPIYVHPDPLS